MTKAEMKKEIIKSFKKQYGFAPAMKDIIPMESSDKGNGWEWLAFCVNGIGYEYAVYDDVQRSEAYDLFKENK